MQPENDGNPRLRPRVELLGTERRTLTSSTLQNYDLYINFPRSYWNTKHKDLYPVLYVLNGQWDFPIAISSFGNLNYDGLIPELIIVGITWSGSEYEDVDFGALSKRDFLPDYNFAQRSGGASDFINILKTEIIPFVESSYPVSSDRCIAGGSLAGLFALYMLFHEPDLFSKYILSSPSVQLQNNAIFSLESLFSKKALALPVMITVSWGELEDYNLIRKFFIQLKSRNYYGLSMDAFQINATGHAGNKPSGFAEGMFFVYKKQKFFLPENELLEYTGIYTTDRYEIKININKGRLDIWVNGNVTALENDKPDSFYVYGKYMLVFFERKNLKVVRLKIEFWDKEVIVEKVS